MDFTLVQHFVRGDGDFWEGVAAKLIHKHGTPQWKFDDVSKVRRLLACLVWRLLVMQAG